MVSGEWYVDDIRGWAAPGLSRAACGRLDVGYTVPTETAGRGEKRGGMLKHMK